MIGRYCFALAGMLMLATAAAAHDSGDAAQSLSPGNQNIVDALHQSQTPPQGSDPLTREEIAALKADSGWGNVFKQLKADGYFPEYKNLGQVVSGFQHRRVGLHQDGPDTGISRTAGSGGKRVHKQVRVTRVKRPTRVRRVQRPVRPQRPNRPMRPRRR